MSVSVDPLDFITDEAAVVVGRALRELDLRASIIFAELKQRDAEREKEFAAALSSMREAENTYRFWLLDAKEAFNERLAKLRDGKDGAPGPQGERGERGEPGRARDEPGAVTRGPRDVARGPAGAPGERAEHGEDREARRDPAHRVTHVSPRAGRRRARRRPS